jgi:hypothetical protein
VFCGRDSSTAATVPGIGSGAEPPFGNEKNKAWIALYLLVPQSPRQYPSCGPFGSGIQLHDDFPPRSQSALFTRSAQYSILNGFSVSWRNPKHLADTTGDIAGFGMICSRWS